MTKEKIPSDLYEALRNAGFQLETQLNEYIHNYMNNKEFAAAASVLKKGHTKLIELLQEFHETASPHLNIPTKKDLANIAKLIVQLEEKVDLLSDQVATLTESVKEKNIVPPVGTDTTESPKENADKESSPWDLLKETRRQRLKAISEIAKSSIDSQLGALASSYEKLENNHFIQLLEKVQRRNKSE